MHHAILTFLHLTLVEPISFMAYSIAAPTTSSADGSNPLAIRCESDCNGHGECLPGGRCRCASGYTGEACEEPVCPVVCSGNGVFSGGVCVCRTGFKGKECDVHAHWCEIADCSGHGRCGDEGVCHCEKGWTGEGCELRACPHPTCSDHGVCVAGQCYCADGWRGEDCATRILTPSAVVAAPTVVAALVPMVELVPSVTEKPRQISRELDRQKLPKASKVVSMPPKCSDHGKFLVDACRCDRGWEGKDCERGSGKASRHQKSGPRDQAGQMLKKKKKQKKKKKKKRLSHSITNRLISINTLAPG